MTLGGAAQSEPYPKCACCRTMILGSPVSMSLADGSAYFCGDSQGCRRRAAMRMERLTAALEMLAEPELAPKTEEAALVQIEVQQIASRALDWEG